MSRDRTNEILTQTARLFIGTAREDEVASHLQPPPDWALLLRTADKEGVAGILTIQLQQLTRELDIELPITPFAEALRHDFARNGNHLAQLARLRESLRKNSIQAIVLKGAALLETSYGGQIGLRPLSDIDLLVKPSDIPVIHNELLTMGFSPANPHSSFYTNGRAAFDLHTDLVGATRIRRRAQAVRFDMGGVWESALPIDDRDGRLLVLSPSFQFLHLAVHALKHSFSRLIWLVDLALVARQQNDWQALLALARETGTMRPLSYALLALDSCLAFEIPEDVRKSMIQPNRIERLFLDLVKARRCEMHYLGEPILAFSIPSWSGRLAYLIEYIFPKRRTLSHDSSSTPSRLLYPRRLGQIVRRGLSYLRIALRSGTSTS
jgi:hypothetical protein